MWIISTQTFFFCERVCITHEIETKGNQTKNQRAGSLRNEDDLETFGLTKKKERNGTN